MGDVEVRGPWTRPAAERFLAEATVPIRLACREPDAGPWMLSLWYAYDERDGRFWCCTTADADVVAFLEADPEVAFEVSTNDPPYRGVRGRGTATVEPDPEKAGLRALLERYLGGTDSPLARRLLAPEREEVRILIDPTKLYAWDYTERMPEGDTESDG
jgi:nitroimidazol reductase NimA-like FMN-containing flavoprotein (pyridoxamine 5'-phosphate oxidase superfamily)